MLAEFLTFINEKEINIRPKNRALLTVSGGLDSMVMLDLFIKSGLGFGIAHCNFQLRGQESDGDEQFVSDYAIKNNIPIFIAQFETKKEAKQQGISTQMAARDLRYAWFENIRIENNYDFIATAHHQDDNLETILLNLCRGTGLAGLHGIGPRNGYIVRPMLFANRAKIEEYAAQNNIVWREDSSNKSTDYKRNKLRKIVLPILKEINPRVESAVYEMTKRVAAAERMLEVHYADFKSKALGFGITNSEQQENNVGKVQNLVNVKLQTINIKFLETEIEPVEMLNHILKNHAFGYSQSVAIWQNRDCEVGKQYFSATHSLTKDRGCFVIAAKPKEEFENVQIEKNQQVSIFEGGRLEFQCIDLVTDFENNKNTVLVNADVLIFPLIVRKWRNGDWFCPLGMAGKRKKVSDFLIDQKIPRSSKKQVLVLESAGEIVWILGLRLDDRYRIKTNTTNAMKINYLLTI
jgi:tRNA(Ile)-lysidine synthase